MHIIVQAGGRGSRLRHHTWNKPKCLVSVNGKPILYHLFDRFPDCEFHIIGNYAFDQLETYLKINAPNVKYNLINSHEKGTCAGIAESAKNLSGPALVIWADLIVNDNFSKPEENTLFLTNDFTCRYSANPDIKQITSNKNGVLGLFYFKNSCELINVPAQGEFVEWYRDNVTYKTKLLSNVSELGEFSTIESNNQRLGFSRYFNEVKIYADTVTKVAVDSAYSKLIDKEIAWYRAAEQKGFKRIPKILNTKPLTMSKIQGDHAFNLLNLTERERRSIIAEYISVLEDLHSRGESESNSYELEEVYITKTQSRVNQIKDIIPNFTAKEITVNGVKCPNIFVTDCWDQYKEQLICNKFTLIHGDPTFSNSLIDDNLKVWFIDPRGYFAGNNIYGDPDYDFAKLYYSACGGYDSFNRRKFKIYVDEETVEIMTEQTGFESVTDQIFLQHFGPQRFNKIKLIHGLLWLSLSGYVIDDIDSILGSFYYGLYWLTCQPIFPRQINQA